MTADFVKPMSLAGPNESDLANSAALEQVGRIRLILSLSTESARYLYHFERYNCSIFANKICTNRKKKQKYEKRCWESSTTL